MGRVLRGTFFFCLYAFMGAEGIIPHGVFRCALPIRRADKVVFQGAEIVGIVGNGRAVIEHDVAVEIVFAVRRRGNFRLLGHTRSGTGYGNGRRVIFDGTVFRVSVERIINRLFLGFVGKGYAVILRIAEERIEHLHFGARARGHGAESDGELLVV